MDKQEWPEISYFHSGSAWARKARSELRVIDRSGYRQLCERTSDGSNWLLDDSTKGNTRFLVSLPPDCDWRQDDTEALEKRLLESERGGASEEFCRWKDCSLSALKGSAFCTDHTYRLGVLK